MRFQVTFLFFVLAFTASQTAVAQNPDQSVDRGIALVQQENFAEAVKTLTAAVKRNKKDIRAWHWLGTALEKQGNLKDAAKAHEQAAKAADELQTAASENLMSLSKTELLAGADSAERYLVLKSSLSDKQRKEWRNRGDFFRVQAASDPLDANIYKSSDVTTRARVLRKPEPSYTTQARNNQVTGRVVLRCVFAADGRIRHINVVRGLPDGLTERSIEAAKQIKFIPAMKDGRPVSVWMQVEYEFHLY